MEIMRQTKVSGKIRRGDMRDCSGRREKTGVFCFLVILCRDVFIITIS